MDRFYKITKRWPNHLNFNDGRPIPSKLSSKIFHLQYRSSESNITLNIFKDNSNKYFVMNLFYMVKKISFYPRCKSRCL